MLRVVNRLLAVVVSLALVGVAVVTVGEVIVAALGRQYWLIDYQQVSDRLTSVPWSDNAVLLGSAAAAAAGALLLLFEIAPRRPRRLQLRPLDGDVGVTASRRNLARTLTQAALDVDGIDQARVTLRRRKAKVRAHTALRERADLVERLEDAVEDRIDSLNFVCPPRPQVRLVTEES